jgi:hypothetical protein
VSLLRSRRVHAALKPLRDIDGVLGAVVWDTGGNLLAHDVPEPWGPDVLREVGVRVAYLCASFSGEPGQFAGTVLVFADHRLQLRVFGALVIGVMMSSDANVSALQMALHIAGRHLPDSLGRGAALLAEPSASHPTQNEAPDSADAPSGGVRLYRGQRLSE